MAGLLALLPRAGLLDELRGVIHSAFSVKQSLEALNFLFIRIRDDSDESKISIIL